MIKGENIIKNIEKLLKFIKDNEDYADKLKCAPYYATIKENPNIPNEFIFKYNMIETVWNNKDCDIMLAARGTIIDIADHKNPKVVCYAFDKFFNYGEGPAAKVDFSTAIIREKIDGSLIRMFPNKDKTEWRFATNGSHSCDSDLPGFLPVCEEKETESAKTFQDLLQSCNELIDDFKSVPMHFTLMFELTSPKNRIVIPYKKTKLTFLGARDMNTFEEITPEEFCDIMNRSSDCCPKIIETTPENVNNLSSDGLFEGVVVCDDKFNRVKIKTEQYVFLHKIKGEQQFSEKHLFKSLLLGTSDDIISYFPEYKELLDIQRMKFSKLKEHLHNIVMEHIYIWNSITLATKELKLCKKRYAEIILSNSYNKKLQPLLFAICKEDCAIDDMLDNFMKSLDLESFEELSI